jgi:hypothetical protein
MFELCDLDRAPSLGGADERTEHQFQDRAFAECIGDDLEATALLDKKSFKQIRNRYEILGADVRLRYSRSWRMVRPSGQRHREHEGVGRPIRTMSRELELVAGRLCDSPGCAESANP